MRAAGTRIGAYEIVSLLGVGGMGEVYRAHDTKLGREVALKVLPASVASDTERLGRFEREARILASLNHPHIGAIYGLEDNAGVSALVLELVDGETLAERLARARATNRGLDLAEALGIARQIADALDAAHERGIVHRDLKPANVKITSDGTVKVLDFGLAKGSEAWAARSGSSGGTGALAELSESPTMMPATVQGVLLGTAPYMSPEQARGKPVDKRTDIWAFGCVLYEMLAGHPAFQGETATDAIAAILEREPDLTAMPASVPASIRHLVQRCLQKDSRRRMRDMGDLRFELDALQDAGADDGRPKAANRRRELAWLAAGAILAAVAVGGAWRFSFARTPTVARDIAFQRITDFVGVEQSPALSPDGRMVAFVATDHGRQHVWIRLLAGGSALRLTGDDGDARSPRWAPGSSSLIYHVPASTAGEEGALWEVPALGGAPRLISQGLGGGDISHDGKRIAVFQEHDGRADLMIVGRDGSAAARVARMPASAYNSTPRWSPDDRWIAYQSIDSVNFDAHVQVVAAEGGEPRAIGRSVDMRGVCWLPDGSGVVYSSSKGSTVAYPPTYSLRIAWIDGRPERQLTFGDVSYVDPDANASGTLMASRIQNQSDIWRIPTDRSPVDNARAAVRITRQTGAAQTPSLSPDGAELVYLSDSGGHGNLWVAKTDGSGSRQLTFERDPARTVGVPVWSPVGGTIAFVIAGGGAADQWLVNRDGSGLRRLTSGVWAYWSPDGRMLYVTVSRDGRYCIDKIPLAGGPPVNVRCDAVAAALSPDGATLYYLALLVRGAGGWDLELRKATPENGASTVLARIPGSSIPVDPLNAHTIVSPDGRWLAIPLTNGTTSNLWALPSDGGVMRMLTDFGDRAVTIARRISWAADGKSIYAAVADVDADVVSLEGLLR